MDDNLNFKVITVGPTAFPQLCRRLERHVAESGFTPDLVIGIKTGGEYVARNMFDDIPHAFVAASRPSSRFKNGPLNAAFNFLLSRLPHAVTDRMRIAEAKRLHAIYNKSDREIRKTVRIPDLPDSAHSILIVDDAVDSGRTMKAVMDAFSARFPEADIRSAAITVTTPDSILSPDYSIFNNQTLIRFPWAADSRHNAK